MDDDEVSKQLDHMVNFIYREAEEKASEIEAKAQEEFSIEKARIVQEEKLKIIKYFDGKEKNDEIKKKIAYSNELNLSRLRVLKAREEGVQKILSDAHKRLGELTADKTKYKGLLKDLIIQGLIKLQEETVHVHYRKEDEELVKGVKDEALKEYKAKVGKECDLTLDEKTYLPPSTDPSGHTCAGGVVLSALDGRILCSNTFDARLSMAFEQQLPEIRRLLFGESLTRKHKD